MQQRVILGKPIQLQRGPFVCTPLRCCLGTTCCTKVTNHCHHGQQWCKLQSTSTSLDDILWLKYLLLCLMWIGKLISLPSNNDSNNKNNKSNDKDIKKKKMHLYHPFLLGKSHRSILECVLFVSFFEESYILYVHGELLWKNIWDPITPTRGY